MKAMNTVSKSLFALLLVSFSCLAVTTIGHNIIIKIDGDGNAAVTERFVLGLNENEMLLFNSISERSINSLNEWQTLAPEINTHVLGETSGLGISTSKASGGQFGNEVKLEYSVKSFADKIEAVGRYETYRVKGDKLLFYDSETELLTLGIADLTIVLPDSVKEEDVLEITPEPWHSTGQSLRWISGTTTNNFVVQYRKEIAISESFNLSRLIETYFVKNPLYGGTIAIIIIFSMIYRRQIANMISESFSSEDNIQLPRKED